MTFVSYKMGLDRTFEAKALDPSSIKSNGGRVVIAVRRSLQFALLVDGVDASLDQLWVKAQTENATVLIGVIYIPPNLQNELDMIERHISSIEKATDLLGANDDLFLFGDYNCSGRLVSPGRSIHVTTI